MGDVGVGIDAQAALTEGSCRLHTGYALKATGQAPRSAEMNARHVELDVDVAGRTVHGRELTFGVGFVKHRAELGSPRRSREFDGELRHWDVGNGRRGDRAHGSLLERVAVREFGRK